MLASLINGPRTLPLHLTGEWRSSIQPQHQVRKSFSFLFTSQLAGRHPIKTLIKTFIHPQTKYNPKDKIMLFNRLCSNKEYLQNVPIISILMTPFYYIPHQCGSGGVVLKKLLLDGCLWFVFKLLVDFPQPCTWTNITFCFWHFFLTNVKSLFCKKMCLNKLIATVLLFLVFILETFFTLKSRSRALGPGH